MDTIAPTIALTYRRVSTYKQERDGVSLDVQTNQCIEYIRRQSGMRLGGDFSDTLTGRTAKRRDYQALLQEARDLRASGHQVAVVTAALDRMGRDLEESVRSRKELKGINVPLHCIREGGVLQDLQANIYASIAQDESERIGIRVKGSRKHHREHGYRSPGRAPWGYVWGEATERERLAGAPKQVLRLDPKTAPYAREAWQRLADGQTVRAIARWAAGLTSEARGGRKIPFPNLLMFFHNPTAIARIDDPERGLSVVYTTDQVTGEQRAQKRRARTFPDLDALGLPAGRWEPLIDDETWVAAHQQVGRHQRVPRQAKGTYLLTGLLWCPCGQRMQGRSSKTRAGGRVAGYACSKPGEGCWFTCTAAAVEQAVLDAIERRLAPWSDPAVARAMRTEWAVLQRPVERPKAGRIKTLERVIAKARQRQDEMLSLLADRVITRERYDRGVTAEQNDVDAAERELAELRTSAAPPTLPPFDDVLAALGGWGQVLAGDDVPEQRTVLAELIERVVPVRISHGKYTVDVKWTPLGDALGAITERVA